MKRLDPAQYAGVQPLFTPLDFNLVIRSMVAGNTHAWVFADRPEAPRLALMWDRMDALFVAGDLQDVAALAAVRNLVHNHILPDARARSIPEVALFSTPVWKGQLPMLLAGLDPRPARRYSYRFPPDAQPPSIQSPAGFGLRPIDGALLASSLVHLADVRGWIDSFWHSPQDFLHNGFGYCAVHNETITAWCLTVFAAGDARELGLATLPEFRERGLAALTAAACVQRGLEQGHEIHWHCWADNLPSVRVAEKTGFAREREYQVYRFSTGLKS